MAASLPRAVLSELLGTALLLAVVIGSGILGERLAQGQAAVALLANTLATVAGLYALIGLLGDRSGAQFNPAVSVVLAARGALAWRRLIPYVGAQVVGAVLGALLAHAMFDLPLLQVSSRARASGGQWLSEAVATCCLVLVVLRAPAGAAAGRVAACIGAGYWFTASTSFANPAVTLARAATDTFAGIRPADVPAFLVAQIAGASAATALFRWLVPAHHDSP